MTPGIGIRSQLVPYPLVGVISPWNFPLLLSVLDSVAALSADTGPHALVLSELRVLRPLVEGYAAVGGHLLAAPVERPSAAPGIGIETQLVPYGLVGVISPWNFPFLISMLDAIPALMAGCAVIVKPSEVTPRFIRPLMQAVAAVPELAGVFAVIEGDGAEGVRRHGVLQAGPT